MSNMKSIAFVPIMLALVSCLPAPHAALNHATDLYREGRYDDAAQEYRRVIDMRPSWALPYVGLGNSLWELNRRPEAVKAYQHAVDLSPDWVEALVSLGQALVDSDRSSEAIPVLTRALQLRPEDGKAKTLLKQARTRAGIAPR
jgi:tetratricopeptide (TPR) repeat protein